MNSFLVAFAMTLVELPAIGIRISPFRGILSRRQLLWLNLCYAAVLLSNFFICYIHAQQHMVNVEYYKFKLIICGAVLTLVNLVIVRRHIWEHLFTCGIEATLSTIIPVLVGFLGHYMPPSDIQYSIMLNAYAYVGIYLVGYIWVRKLIVNAVEPFLELESDGYWRTVSLIPLCLFFSNFFTYPSETYVTEPAQFVGQLLMIAAEVLICLTVARDPGVLKSRAILAKNLEIQRQYFTTLTDQIDKARRELHDAKYRVAAIEKYIETDDKEGLVEYCKTMIPKRYYSVELFHSGNSAVDGILYHYSQRANQENIEFKIAGTVQKQCIPDDEMCTLLGNAMENAFAGCMTLETGRFITFVAQTEENVLSLLVTNSFDGKINVKGGVVQSRKRVSGPGFGLSSMRLMCRKHGGTFETQWDDETFTVLIILPLNNT